jgi:hypothetical protein
LQYLGAIVRNWWRKLSYEIPLAVSEALWEVLVVQFAALLERLTIRQIIAFIPVLVLILAYAHRIPLPPELMLVGDILAYIDVFSVILLLGILSRAATIVFFVRQAAERTIELTRNLHAGLARLDFRHRRKRGASGRKRSIKGAQSDDDGYGVIRGAAWA